MIYLDKIRRILTFFAHPDDETLAAGATISKLTSLGVDIHVAIPATGIYGRKNTKTSRTCKNDLRLLRMNCQKALRLIGIPAKNIYLGDFPDNEMDKRSLLELVHWLETVIKDVNPEVILTHHRYCTNIDHQYCHQAAVVATRPGLNSHISVIAGEIPSSTGYLRPAQWEPNLYIEVTERDVERKIQAMETYKGEARSDPHPRSREVLKAIAKVRGSESGFYFAESFMIQKAFSKLDATQRVK